MTIRVLIVDDSALVRQLLREILNSDPDIEVVGYAADPYAAREKIKKLNPDVLTLDVEMPRMDGISFLRNLMRLRPMPVVMVSSLTREGADETLEALALGAVDFVAKPAANLAENLRNYSDEIIGKVKVAAQARVRPAETRSREAARGVKAAAPVIGAERSDIPVRLIALGASTGGVEAIKELVQQLPERLPGMLVVQHIPKEFSRAFAERINRSTTLTVKEAEDSDEILPGHVFIAPGDRHLLVTERSGRLYCELSDGDRVNQHRPSVDVLFGSVANVTGAESVGILLTGMGADGAAGLMQMHDQGAATIAQDEQTSVIWGMPREAIMLGCVDHVLPLSVIPECLQGLLEKQYNGSQSDTRAHSGSH